MTKSKNTIGLITGTKYTCRCCGRSTIPDSLGAGVRMCAECYDLSAEESSLEDTGAFEDTKANVLALIGLVRDKGGDASCWSKLEAIANKP